MDAVFDHTTYLPPGYDGPFQYFWTLFALSFMSLASSAMVIGYILEARVHMRLKQSGWREVKTILAKGHYNAAEVARFFITMLYLTVVIGVTPDVLKLLAWNEIEAENYLTLARVDAFCDGLSSIPFIIGISVHIWSRQSLEHLLGLGRGDVGTVVRTIRFSKAAILWTAKLAGLLLIVAMAVTASKVVAGAG